MIHICETCELGNAATWDDFERKVRDQYSEFRKAGGEAFIGFWIPHTGEDQEGHRYVHCPGSYLLILGYSDEESSLTFFDEDGEIERITIPWQDMDPDRKTKVFLNYEDRPWLDSREANSVEIAARKAVDMLRNRDENPINAWFTDVDWVMNYED
jgi:hypothetical protein